MSTSTKVGILHEASRMLLSKGLNGFSLQELALKLNIKKASLFHHYPSKLDLAVELYRFYQASFLEWAQENAHLSAEKQMLAYVDKLTNWICDKQRVCPVGALSLEWQLVDPRLQVEIKKLHEIQKEWLTSLLKALQKENGLKVSVPEAAIGMMGLIQGSIQIARIIEDPNLAKKTLRSYLKSIKVEK